MLKQGIIAASIAALAMLSLAPTAVADDMAEMKETIQALQSRLDKMEAEKANQVHKDEMAKMMKEILADAKMQPAMPKWMKNLTFYGDLRLRFESRVRSWSRYNTGAADWRDSDKNRNRMRYRLRFGFKKTWWDKQMEIGFRLATGGSGAGTSDSRNADFGDQYGDKDIAVDLIYAKYCPKWAKGLEFTAGKMKNPIASKTGMSWDGDINPEGFHLKYTAPFFGDFKPYAAFGYWIWDLDATVDRNPVGGANKDNAPVDVTYWTYELGFDWQIMKDLGVGMYATYYGNARHWDANTAGDSGPYADWVNKWDEPRANFGITELTTQAKWKLNFLPKPMQKWKAWFSWVHNCKDTYNGNYPWVGAGAADPQGADTFEDQNNAYNLGIKMGENKKKGDISAGFEYRWVELNALPSIGGSGWPDSDFANSQNTTNVRGWIISTKYNIDDFLTIGGKLIVAEPISSSFPYATNGNNGNFELRDEDSSCLVQVDMVWKF